MQKRIHVVLTHKRTFEVIDIPNCLQINLKAVTLDKWVVYTATSTSTEYSINDYDLVVIGLNEVAV